MSKANHSPAFLKLVESIRSTITETTPQVVKEKFSKETSAKLVDVREESEWNTGHIPGAIHLGKGIIERDIENIIPDKNTEIILYCGGGFRSLLAADNLRKMGYTNLISMDGGWRLWQELKYPTE